MTAEIAILNRSAIVLAADSAVTIGTSQRNKQRVWKTTNKLFSLSPENDIGIMIYGTGDFCGVPWETIIKLFSQKEITQFNTVEDCKVAFLNFVDKFSTYDENLDCLNASVLLVQVVGSILDEGKDHGGVNNRKKKITERVNADLKILKNGDGFGEFLGEKFAISDFLDEYTGFIEEIISERIDFNLSKNLKSNLLELCFEVLRRRYPSGYETGIVFAGFGGGEYFPCMSPIIIDGKSEFGLRWWSDGNTVTMDRWKETSAIIRPFAQRDIAHLFIEGIEESYIEFLEITILGAMDKKSKDIVESYVPATEELVESELQKKENRAAIRSLLSDFRELRQKSIVEPMLDVLRNLPKEEMAAMAESLVEITSLRRRMDSDVESVSGPVDVAIISKGDGLVWMKRKHYFDIEMNSEFVTRRSARRKLDD